MRRESSVAVLLGLAIVLSLALDIAHADKEASPGADVMQIRALLERRQFVRARSQGRIWKGVSAHEAKRERAVAQ